MALSDTDTHHYQKRASRRANIVLIGFLLVVGFYLVTEHRAHLFGILPFLFLPLCLVMHRFMHGGHGHGDAGNHLVRNQAHMPHETPSAQSPIDGARS